MLDDFSKTLGLYAEEVAVFINALAVGAWNSVMDLLQGILDLIILIGGSFNDAWQGMLNDVLGQEGKADTPHAG